MEFDEKLFQEESAIDLGGDGAEFDIFAGFDDEPETSDGSAAPTTEQDAGGASEEATGAEGQTPEAQPASDPAPITEQTEASPLTFKAKIDHEEQDITLNPEDLPTIYQKATNMDRAVQRAEEAKQESDRYRNYVTGLADVAQKLGFEGDTPEARLDAMLSGVADGAISARVSQLVQGGTAQEVAEYVVKQQIGIGDLPTLGTTAADDGQTAEAEGTAGPPSPEQFSQDLQNLLARRPDLGANGEPFPDEVIQAYMRGEDLTVAYLDYEAKHTAAEREELEKQNRIYKQNQESAARAPVKGVKGSGSTGGQEDIWTAGFADPTW